MYNELRESFIWRAIEAMAREGQILIKALFMDSRF
jgi:hypothetical protein